MKTLGRMAIILGAALLVCGAMWAFVQYGGASNLAVENEHGGRPEMGDFPTRGEPPSGLRGDDQREGRGEGGVFGLAQLIKNVVIVGALVALVTVISQTVAAVRKWRPHSGAPTR